MDSLFYRGLLKCWYLFKTERLEASRSLFWLLQELLIKGACLDVTGGCVPDLTRSLCVSNLVTLGRLVDAVGPGLADFRAVTSVLGLRSTRHTKAIVDQWVRRLELVDWALLWDYWDGRAAPDSGDPFPYTGFTPDFKGMSGPLLGLEGLQNLNLLSVSRKTLYRCYV